MPQLTQSIQHTVLEGVEFLSRAPTTPGLYKVRSLGVSGLQAF